jgi:hypothetical protein
MGSQKIKIISEVCLEIASFRVEAIAGLPNIEPAPKK